MTVTIVLGTQWGDEGKGKAVDFLSRGYDLVARFNGGNNAGHTVVNSYGTFKIHLVPTGIFHPNTHCLIGPGVVIDPAVLIDEMNTLRGAGIDLEKRLRISPRAHLIMPYHKSLDGLYEEAKGTGATGTTRRGIGPAYADKLSYNGIRWTDLADPSLFAQKLQMQIELKNRIISALGGERLDFESVYEEYNGYYRTLHSYIAELYPLIRNGLYTKKKFLLEQAMGTFLDPDWGTYPFVTGSSTLASAATPGLGIPPRAITRIVGVTKAYTTRVGAGPLPTEIMSDGRERQVLAEVAATTGRSRRAGWLDLELVRFAAELNGVDELFLTKLDVLSEFDTIPVGTGYLLNGRRVRYPDLDTYRLGEVEPIYRQLSGWCDDIRGVRRFQDLPKAARRYVETIERFVGVPVRWISVGPEREATIRR